MRCSGLDPPNRQEVTIRINKRSFREPPPRPEHRVNHAIRFSPVRLVGEDGQQIGVVSVDEAKRIARERGLDLVEVAPDARPVVCKLLDYGRFRYDLEKKARESRKNQHQVEVKEVKVRPGIGDHDLATKLGRARSFLERGQHVKVTVMFRGREMRRPSLGFDLLERVVDELDDVATIETPPPAQLTGRDLTMVLKSSS